jgi:anti-sigma factor RsiW
MNCSQAKKLISLQIDEELDARGRSELAAHCAGCPGCARELRELTALFTDFSAPVPLVPSPYFLGTVMRRVHAWEADRGFSLRDLRWPRLVTLGATIALLLLAGNFAGTTLWSSLAQQPSLAAADTGNDAALIAFNDLPQEYAGIYADAAKG